MKRDTTIPLSDFNSSFLSCEKDLKTIFKKLFIESKPFSEYLIRLLVINTKDCIDDLTNEIYKNAIKDMTLTKLRENGYIRLEPKIKVGEHEEVKTRVIIDLDDFSTNAQNPEFRDCTINIHILCHSDYWDLGDFKLRPLKIAGYIDGILNKARLSGIGQLLFIQCSELVLDEEFSGYSLSYRAIHGFDDRLPQ